MPQTLRLSNVLAALSHALDLTEGQPKGHSIRTCMIGMEIGQHLGLSAGMRSDLFYSLLLKDAGCSANAAPLCELFESDDQPVKKAFKTVDWSTLSGTMKYAIENAAGGAGPLTKLKAILRLARAGDTKARELVRIRCERGADLVDQLGFPPATAEAIRYLDEHWNGKGHPFGLEGEQIPLLSRIAGLAQTFEVFLNTSGIDVAMDVLRVRSGTWFDPTLVDVVEGWAGRTEWWERVRTGGSLEDLSDVEPSDEIRMIAPGELDTIAAVFAQVIDAKTPYTARHSSRVAGVARSLGGLLGFSELDVRRLNRAGLLHDIGKLGVSNRILDKTGRLTNQEFEAIKQHPKHTFDILSRIDAFADILEPAANHHERLDGGGYPRGLTADDLDVPCRILAVADVYEAITARRPYRDPMSFEQASAVLRDMAGRALDRHLVELLLSGAAKMGSDFAEWGQEWPRAAAAGPGSRRDAATTVPEAQNAISP